MATVQDAIKAMAFDDEKEGRHEQLSALLQKIDDAAEVSGLSAMLQRIEEQRSPLLDAVRQWEERTAGFRDYLTETQERLNALRGPEILRYEPPQFDFHMPEIEPMEDVVRRVVREELERAANEPPPDDDERLYGADGVKRTPGFKKSDD